MKTLLTRLGNGLFKNAQHARHVKNIDYPLNAYGSDAQLNKRLAKPLQAAVDKACSKEMKQPVEAEQERTFKPYAYLNKYGQMVMAPEPPVDTQLHVRDSANEQALRQLIAHSMVCSGFLSKNYRIALEPEDDKHLAYNIVIRVPAEFAFTEQRRILVEEIIYASAHEKLTVDVASIVWLSA